MQDNSAYCVPLLFSINTVHDSTVTECEDMLAMFTSSVAIKFYVNFFPAWHPVVSEYWSLNSLSVMLKPPD